MASGTDEIDKAGPAAGDYPPARTAWWTVAVLIVLSCLSLLDRQIMALLIPAIRAELGINDFQVGLLQGVAFSLFYGTFGLVLGWAVDRYARRPIIFIGVCFWSLATSACGLAGNSIELMLARFGVGAGEAALSPASYSIVGDSFPKRRLAFALSVYGIGGQLGVGVSLLLGGYLIAVIPAEGLVLPLLGQLSAWRAVFLAAGLPGVVIALLVWTLRDPPRRDRLAAGEQSWRDTLRFVGSRKRLYGGISFGFALLSTSGFGYYGWAAVFLMRHFHVDVTQVVTILAPSSTAGGIAGLLLAGFTSDRLFARGMKDAHLRVFIAVAPLHCAAVVLAMLSTNLTWFVIWSTLAAAGLSYVGVVAAALQLVTPNNFRGQVSSGFLFMSTLIGTGLGPAIVGALSSYAFHDDSKLGWAISLNSLIACPLAMLALGLALKPMRRGVVEARMWMSQPNEIDATA